MITRWIVTCIPKTAKGFFKKTVFFLKPDIFKKIRLVKARYFVQAWLSFVMYIIEVFSPKLLGKEVW